MFIIKKGDYQLLSFFIFLTEKLNIFSKTKTKKQQTYNKQSRILTSPTNKNK